jgi:hypothetical protein
MKGGKGKEESKERQLSDTKTKRTGNGGDVPLFRGTIPGRSFR